MSYLMSLLNVLSSPQDDLGGVGRGCPHQAVGQSLCFRGDIKFPHSRIVCLFCLFVGLV